MEPLIGLRVRLASLGRGNWQNTGGEKSKFGLSAPQVLEAVRMLKASDLGRALKLLHVHLGSQIPELGPMREGIREAARYYAELHRLGLAVDVLDVGGGLAVDYEGTGSANFCSMTYGVNEYAQAVVEAISQICAAEDLPHPDILTESGRALTAHHAVLVTNVTDVERATSIPQTTPDPADPEVLGTLWELLETAGDPDPATCYRRARIALEEAQRAYTDGRLDLAAWAWAEDLYRGVCRRVRDALAATDDPAVRELEDELHQKLADRYFCNLSVFQSLPDIWALDQIFPIMPLQRLDETPTRRALLRDLTCDSDGRIDYYVDAVGIEHSLAVHPVRPGEPYLLGFFLVGAYQEVLGDMHNLFGTTDSVNVEATGGHGFRLLGPRRGSTADELLSNINFEPAELLSRYDSKLEAAELEESVRKRFRALLEAGLNGQTYLQM